MLDFADQIARWSRRRRWLNLVAGAVVFSVGAVLALGFGASQIYACPQPQEPNVTEMADAWERAVRKTATVEHAAGQSVCDDALSALLVQWQWSPEPNQRWFDPWGNMWQFRCYADSVVVIRSAGPDGVVGTQDDILRAVDVSR